MLVLLRILELIGIFVFLPILAYLVTKFAAAGYFRARRREKEKDKTNL